MTQDYYELLGVSQGAGSEDIKRAYRKLALQYHPDRNPGDQAAEERFKEISNAFQVLSDPEKRQLYDRFGPEGVSRAGFSGFSNVQDIFSSFGDLFSDIFGGLGGFGGFGRREQRGADVEVAVELTFEEAAEGARKDVPVKRRKACETCRGTGAKPGTSPERCGTCEGRGQVMHSQGFFMVSSTCPRCHGQGQVVRHRCSTCEGRGQAWDETTLQVNIPAGIDDGQTLRIAGKGEASPDGGSSGHLYVHVHVTPHEVLERRGADLFVEVPLSVPQAALGCQVVVPALGGDETIDVAAGTQSGDLMVLRGKGLPQINGRSRGDQLLGFRVEVPTKLSTRAKELLRQLADELGDSVDGPGLIERLKAYTREKRKRQAQQ